MMLNAGTTITQYNMLREGDRVLVCVSGGADSFALLHFMLENKKALGLSEVAACHVNHGLRGEESDAEQTVVERWCAEHGVRLECVSLNMTSLVKPKGKTVEEWARELRYAAFSDTAKRMGAKILTAHNMNDNAETVLLNLARGAGLLGAGGIPPVRGGIVRPFIETSRADIEAYCRQNNLPFVTDSSNLTDAYSRNKLRHSAMPVLRKVNAAADANIARFASVARTASEYILSQAQKLLVSARTEGGYSCDSLLAAHEAVTDAALYSLIEPYNKSSRALKLCREVVEGKLASTQLNDDYTASRRDGVFSVSRIVRGDAEEWSIRAKIGENPLKGGETVIVQQICGENLQIVKKNRKLLLKNCLDYDKIVGNICFQSRRSGAEFDSRTRASTKSLKKLLNEMAVPEHKRNDYPVAYDDEGVVWVKGEGVAGRVALDDDTKEIWCFMEGIMHEDIKTVLITEDEIKKKIAEMGKLISKDFAGKNLIMISVLKGAVVFVSDLMRAVDIHTEIDFMSVSSFRGGVVSTGAVRIVKDLDISLEGRDILIVEDILDSGKTLEYIQQILWSRHPNSLKICTLLDKPSRRQSSIVADYVGFVIPDEFVVGYGLDYAEKYRNLPYIGILKPCVYSKSDAEILGV